MIENEELGLEIATSPQEALIKRSLQASKERILQMELGLEIEKVVSEHLEKKTKV
jgi:hypothetical protein